MLGLGMTIEQPSVLKELEGFSPRIGSLVSMMYYARMTTLDTIHDLTTEQIDFLVAPNANTIGMLLSHMAALEVYYQVTSFEGRTKNTEEKVRWNAAAELGDLGRAQIKNNDLNFYLEQFQEVREKTLSELKSRDDSWLMQQEEYRKGVFVNNYWKWFHMFEDEINHRGQIRLIRNHLLP